MSNYCRLLKILQVLSIWTESI